MKKTSFFRLIVSSAAAAVIGVLSAAMSAGAAWKQVDIMGDINGDGSVGISDVVSMCRYLHGTSGLSEKAVCRLENARYVLKTSEFDFVTVNGGTSVQKADLDRNGKTDVFDLVLLRKRAMSSTGGEILRWYEETAATTTSSAATTTTVTTTSATTTSTTSTTAVTTQSRFISPPVSDMYGSMPSQDDVNLLIFYVDFPDCKFGYEPTTDRIEEIAFGEENKNSPMYPFESFSAFCSRASKGNMKLGGKAYRYTAKNNIASYQGDVYKSDFVTEAIKNMDSTVDYSEFDANGDKKIDAILFCVPESSDRNEWWSCAGAYYGDYRLRVDGMTPGHVITGNDVITGDSNYSDFISTYLHEMGHCMGLPDYYLYNAEDSEGLHGSAGYDLMDEAKSDYSAASKLMLGWYRENQVQIYDRAKGTQTFTLTNGQLADGNCLIIPRGEPDSTFKSEFFILEYTTLDENNVGIEKNFGWRPHGSGVRLLHIEATQADDGWRKFFMYENRNDNATNKNAGKRFIRLVNDANKDNLLRTGAVIDSGVSGFAWYADDGSQSIAPDFTITIGEKTGDSYTVTVAPKY